MDETSIKYIGGTLSGLSHSSYVDEFIYSDTTTGITTRYTKTILHGQTFFVTETITQQFSEQVALQLLK